MSRLVWNETGTRKYETGVNHGVLYPQDEAGKYPKGVAWCGLTSVTESPSGAEETALYADNIKYASLRSAEQLGLTIEAYQYPDEFEACDGSAAALDGVYVGQQSRQPLYPVPRSATTLPARRMTAISCIWSTAVPLLPLRSSIRLSMIAPML